MKRLLLFFLFGFPMFAQGTRWYSTTGDVSLTSSATVFTIQQPATNQNSVYIDQAVVYCSAACTFTQTVNGTGATTTAGTVTAILPTQLNQNLNINSFTASNVSGGTQQGGITHVPAGSTVIICLSPSCGAGGQVSLPTGQGINANYNVVIASVTATVNITILGRSL